MAVKREPVTISKINVEVATDVRNVHGIDIQDEILYNVLRESGYVLGQWLVLTEDWGQNNAGSIHRLTNSKLGEFKVERQDSRPGNILPSSRAEVLLVTNNGDEIPIHLFEPATPADLVKARHSEAKINV